MDEHLNSVLTYATAMPVPLRLQVRNASGSEQQVSLQTPFAIIGRGADSHIRLPEQTVSFRHAYLQAIGPRVACIDLLSLSGIQVTGAPYHGWLTAEHVLKIGTSEIRLLDADWLDEETLKPPLEFRPRDEQRLEYGMLPQVELELLNTPHQGRRWPINRVITLIGRDEGCRITIADERLSRVQCSLLLLPSGLWAIDLMGKGGIQLDGQLCPCGLLTPETELTIGDYRLKAHYQATVATSPLVANNEDFITRPNRIYQADFYHDTVILSLSGDTRMFMYKDVYIEANRVCDLIKQRGFNNLLVDFSRTTQLSHLVVEGLMSICRAVPGHAVMCNANEDVAAELHATHLARLLSHYQSLPDALQAIYLNA
jgi:pSer/pThr/pTyr-binding forkhead associated (FHA) protein